MTYDERLHIFQGLGSQDCILTQARRKGRVLAKLRTFVPECVTRLNNTHSDIKNCSSKYAEGKNVPGGFLKIASSLSFSLEITKAKFKS